MNDYFCGLYFKCQSKERTLAVIPAFHKTGGEKTASVQLICDEGAFNIPFSYEDFSKNENRYKVGKSYFGMGGIHLDIDKNGLQATGDVAFTELSPLRYGIMGPFRFVPFMECRHSVFSMHHSVCGSFFINGKEYSFSKDNGYIEGDCGRSFPKEYLWTHCFFENGSLMLSVADIPMGGIRFTGVICAVLYRGQEYRLATYLGGKAAIMGNGEVVIRQGDSTLSAKLLKKAPLALKAPVVGEMSRTIHESAACRAAYSFKIGARTVFEFESDLASFEYEYDR